MVYRKSKKFVRKAGRGKKSKYIARKKSRYIAPTTNPFPQFMFTKLRYSDKFTLTISSAVPATHQFNLMNMFDPDRTGTGHQPYYYDELTTLYKYANVYGCKLELRFISSGSVKVIARPAVSAAVPSNLPLEEERPYSKNRLYASGGPAGFLGIYCPIHTLFGRTKKQVLTDDLFQQQLGTGGPTHTGVWNVISNVLDTTSSASVYCNVRITYYAKVWERKSVSQS